MNSRIEPPKRHLPPPGLLLGALDRAAKDAATKAKDTAAPILQAAAPRGRTGRLSGGLGGRMRKTPTGYEIVIGVKSRGAAHDRYATVAQVNRFVNRGTGERRKGPGPKNRITARGEGMLIGNGTPRKSVRGQAPNPFFERTRRPAASAVSQAIEISFRENARHMRPGA